VAGGVVDATLCFCSGAADSTGTGLGFATGSGVGAVVGTGFTQPAASVSALEKTWPTESMQ
jgi:hypothetical protein